MTVPPPCATTLKVRETTVKRGPVLRQALCLHATRGTKRMHVQKPRSEKTGKTMVRRVPCLDKLVLAHGGGGGSMVGID